MTDIVEVPAAPEVPPFPALGSNNYNDEAYAAGVALPELSVGIHAIGVAARTNATAAKEQAQAAVASQNAATAQADAAMGYRNAAQDAAGNATAEAGRSRDEADRANAQANRAQIEADTSMGYRNAAQAAAGNSTVEANRARAEADRAEEAAASISGGPVTSVNGQTGVVVLLPEIINIEYDDRAQLRSNIGTHALVDGLGLFRYVAESDEPDDDESCFATADGRWLLECPHWDVVDAWRLPDEGARDEFSDSLGHILRVTATCPVTSVSSMSQAAFIVTVPGAVAGAAALATPRVVPDARLVICACVSAENTVTVTLSNPSAETAGSIPASWQVTVFKEI